MGIIKEEPGQGCTLNGLLFAPSAPVAAGFHGKPVLF